MINLLDYINVDSGISYFKVKILANSSENEIVGVLGENIIKIRIKSLREKQKANKELISFLSSLLGVSKTNIKIKSGSLNSIKIIRVDFNN